MKLALITDAWHPQVNGVVTTLHELVISLHAMGVQVEVIHPGLFERRPCPGYAGIDLAVRPAKMLARMLDDLQPDAVHLATEGPLGWAARKICLKKGWAFSTAFHTKFPEILNSALRVPLSWGYALFRHFHKPSSAVMVPTQGVLEMLQKRQFKQLKPWTHGVDTRLFGFHERPLVLDKLAHLPRPLSLFVGRISYEKNIEAFLKLELPGTKIVCGVGPLEASLQSGYSDVHWMGVLPRDELAKVYAAADVFVFPSRSETFGLVMLEAMATGTPVAAYPVDGPLQVLGADQGESMGGVLDADLQTATLRALTLPRAQARLRAEAFGWDAAAALFTSNLVSVHAKRGKVLSTVTLLSPTT
jgi:glycosyltransferase involved in cell wall biosynthesis